MAINTADASIKSHYVDWAAVIAGAVLAAAISFVLFTAGAAIGLSLVSAQEESHNALPGYLAAFWAIAVPIGSLLAGGYVAGRMRAAWSESETEGDFRDGVHGALVWGVSVLIGAMLATSAASTAANVTASAASGVASTASAAAPAVGNLLQAQPGAKSSALTGEQQSQLSAVLARSAKNGSISDNDRAFLNSTVAQATGIPPAEAEKRVNDAYNATLQAVETARKVTVAAGLITATGLLIGLVAAWYAAQRGGNHRDNDRPARLFTLGSTPPNRGSGPGSGTARTR